LRRGRPRLPRNPVGPIQPYKTLAAASQIGGPARNNYPDWVLLKKGDTWERTSKMNLGGGQVLTVTTRYTYEGEIEKEGRKLDRITSKSLTVDFALEPDSPLPLTVKSSELKPSESKGEILFDRALGQAVETSGSVTIVGNMTFVIMGNELPSKLNLTMESSTVVKP
jgi:hypothetical protein